MSRPFPEWVPEWDKVEYGFSADGPLIRYSISERDGIRFELSMQDEKIMEMAQEKDVFAVMSFPTNNVKIEPVAGGGFTALIKVGAPKEAGGNLFFYRVTRTGPKFSLARYLRIVELLLTFLDKYGIHLDKHVTDTIRRN
jgi:hypothetical protein